MSDENPVAAATTPPPAPSGTPTKDECTMGMFAHLAALAGYLIPFGNIIGPMVIYLMKKDQSAFIADQARESMNFQITMMFLIIISIIGIFCVVGIFLLPIVGLLNLIFIIVGAIQASKGVVYRYPFALRLIK